MSAKKLHPSVQQFKDFVKKHPRVLDEVRTGKATLQELYEDWYLFGEEDTRWDSYKEESLNQAGNDGLSKVINKDLLSSIVKTFKNLDVNQVQMYIENLSQALGALQGVISQFQGGNSGGSSQNHQSQEMRKPFQFRKD